MTTLREAAQMALDAMLNFPDDISDDMFESIKALRAALAQPPCATGSQCVGNKCERCVVQEREWQGLTDEERAFLAWESENGPDCVEMTEFKLWEKNR